MQLINIFAAFSIIPYKMWQISPPHHYLYRYYFGGAFFRNPYRHHLFYEVLSKKDSMFATAIQ